MKIFSGKIFSRNAKSGDVFENENLVAAKNRYLKNFSHSNVLVLGG